MKIDSARYLKSFIDELSKFQVTSYEDLPDMDLYMEQLIGYFDKKLKVFQESSMDKLITPSMINNYVKGEVIPAPRKKKYSEEQIALLTEVSLLKQVLSINEAKEIIEVLYTKDEISFVYNNFKELFDENLNETINSYSAKIDNSKGNEEALTKIALELSVKASIYSIIAKRILFIVNFNLNEAKAQKAREEKEQEIKRINEEKEKRLNNKEA